MSLARRLRDSIRWSRSAYFAGYKANDQGYHTGACPFPNTLWQRWLRNAWLKGWRQSESMRGEARS